MKSSRARGDRHLADVRPREERAVDVDRVARRGHQRGVTGAEQDPHEVAEALLGADGVDDLGLGVELHPEGAQVQVGDGPAQLRDAPAGRVPVVARLAGRLGQLLHDQVGRGDVRVAEPEVDDVVAGSAEVLLDGVDDREDVGRHALDATELHGSSNLPPPRSGPRGGSAEPAMSPGRLPGDVPGPATRRCPRAGYPASRAMRAAPRALDRSPRAAGSMGSSARCSAPSTCCW